MPGITQEQFLSKAQKNSRFTRKLQASDIHSPEWVVVGAFYSAVHYVNAYLAKTSPRFVPKNHIERNFYVNSVKELKPISRSYPRLSAYAYEARYTIVSFNRGFSQELIDEDLTPIESHLLSLLQ